MTYSFFTTPPTTAVRNDVTGGLGSSFTPLRNLTVTAVGRTLDDWPLVERPGGKKTVQRIVYQNCTVAGQKNVNKDFN